MNDSCVRCGAPATNQHHRKMRSQGGDDSLVNLLPLCGSGTTGCHGWVHANPAESYELGLLVHSWEDPALIPVKVGPMEEREEAAPVEEGKSCPTCRRRVPHKKKKESPKSKVFGYRVAVDEADTHREMLDAWAEHWGLSGKPFHLFWLINYAAAEALAGPKRELAPKKELG